MKTHDVKQGSSEWTQLRLGLPTASEFDALVSPKWEVRTGEGPKNYLYKKLCEKYMGFARDAGSWAMEQGTILEHEALPWYEFTHDVKVQRVGFCTTDDGRIGCSPDGLIGEDGGIEIKCPQPEMHLRYLMEGGVPREHLAQVHGSMFATGRQWWLFMSYSRQFSPHIVRVERDEEIQSCLSEALNGFLAKFDSCLFKMKAMRDAENAKHLEA